jgi:aminoglycoside phosphotransferase (APT) family kinase protein
VTRRVALLDPEAERVLTVAGALPSVADDWPTTADLRAAVGAPLAIPGPAPWRDPAGTVTHTLVGESTLDGSWVPADAVAGLAEAALRWRSGDPAGAPWFARGWWESVLTWLDDVVPGHGRPEIVQAWGISAVLRVPTPGGDLWFKAAGAGFHDEPRLARAVARLAPTFVPRVVATDRERGWLLTADVPGAAAGITTAAQMVAAAARFAELQLASRTRLAALGAPDRGLESTLAMVGEVLHRSVDLLTPAQRALAPTLESWLVERLRAFWAGPLPDTLVHGDLHCANVAWTPTGPVVFDWTDLCVSHPFLDAALLAQSAAQHDPAAGPAVWEAYLGPWRSAYPHADLAAVRAAVPVADRIFQAISYERILRAQPVSARWELGTSVGRGIDRLAALRGPSGSPSG